jgi:DNA segregation ATPase FtsK/SpoIIIE-like protein
MELLQTNQIEINKAGYLVSIASQKPVNHPAFVAEQEAAHYVVMLAKAIEGKTFKVANADDFAAIEAAVLKSINEAKVETYVKTPAKPAMEITNKLAEEAMAFVNHGQDVSKANQINAVMNQFNTINAIENVGDYFTEGLVKLKAIYTIAEIQAAVEARISKIGR